MEQEQSKTQSVETSPWDVKGGDKSKGAKYIAEHPEEFGFSWGQGAIGNGVGAGYVELRKDCPHVEIAPEQVYLFINTFGPALIAKGVNGTSFKVSCDRVNRTTLEKDRSVKNDVLREKIVSSLLLGVIVRTGGVATTKYVVNGQEFKTEAEAKKYADNADRIKQLEAAQAFLSMAAENGIDSKLARSMAQSQWPRAFETAPEQQG